MMRHGQITRSKMGFSMAETLVALIIILLVSSIVAAGMPAAQKAFLNVKESANAQVLLSTTLTELRNELSTASKIEPKGNYVTFIDPVTGDSKIELKGNKLWLTTYRDINAEGNLAGGIERPLVSDAAKTASLSLDFGGNAPFPATAYSEGNTYFTLTGFTVKSDLVPNSELAGIGDYKIAIIVP